VPGPDGRRVRLEACRIGGRWLTSEQALARWSERLTPRVDAEQAPAPHTPAQRAKASDRAARQLEEFGV
jgi:hypothetical protein